MPLNTIVPSAIHVALMNSLTSQTTIGATVAFTLIVLSFPSAEKPTD